MRLLTAMVGALACFAPGASVAQADDLPPTIVAFTSAKSSIRIPETTTVTARADSAPAGYGISIVDDDSGRVWGQCSLGPWGVPGTSCTTDVYRTMDENADPQPLRLHAEVRGPNGYRGPAVPLTIDVQRRTFNVEIHADRSSITVPESATATATVDEPVTGEGSYYIAVFDKDTGQQLQACNGNGQNAGTATTCPVEVARDWDDNLDPAPFNLEARVQNNGGQDIASNTAETTVDVDQHLFDPSLSFPAHPNPTEWTAEAKLSEPVPHGYNLAVEKHPRDFGYSCNASPCSRSVGPGTYRATVLGPGGQSYGVSPWRSVDANGEYDDHLGGLDLVALSQAVGTPDELCLGFNRVREPFESASVSKLYFACDALAKQGLTTLEIARRVALLTGGIAALQWINANQTGETIVAPSTRPIPQSPDDDPDDGTPLPPFALVPSSHSDVNDFIERNGNKLSDDLVTKRKQAEAILNQCRVIAITISRANPDRCDTKPIFVTGPNHQRAGELDLYALNHVDPTWAVLTHRQNHVPNARPERWYRAESECLRASTPVPSSLACHEFPYRSALENDSGTGSRPGPRPALELIPSFANSGQEASSASSTPPALVRRAQTATNSSSRSHFHTTTS